MHHERSNIPISSHRTTYPESDIHLPDGCLYGYSRMRTMRRGKHMKSVLLVCLHYAYIPLTYQYNTALCPECDEAMEIVPL